MNRDPKNQDCTRDPIYLLQFGLRQWTQIPSGIETDGESLWVENADDLDDWIQPFIEDGYVETSDEFWREAERAENDHGWPMVYVDWRTESVWLTRDEAEAFARRHEYRWEKWRVYCVPCEGELAKLLNQFEPATVVN